MNSNCASILLGQQQSIRQLHDTETLRDRQPSRPLLYVVTASVGKVVSSSTVRSWPTVQRAVI